LGCGGGGLFIARASALNQEFQLDDSTIGIIAGICARLDGLPLAIELAAARTKALPPAALLSRLDNQLGLLRSDARDLPRRMRAMRATIDWSYGLLEAGEQRAFRMLSIFAGDFSLDAAIAVLGESEDATIDLVASLIDKSLLVNRPPFSETPFYRMLAAVREFGFEQLAAAGEHEVAKQRQAEHLAELVERLYLDQFNQNQAMALRLLDRTHENIRQSLAWTVDTEQWELAARIAGRIWQYWDVRGHLAEGSRWLHLLISQEFDYPLSLLPDLYYGCAILVGSREEATRNQVLAQRIMEIAEEHDIPMHGDPMLVEHLLELDLGESIPPQLYAVMAEVLIMIQQMEKKY
jgi:predicted ATPase